MARQLSKGKGLFYSGAGQGGNVAGALHQDSVLVAEESEQVAAGDAALYVVDLRLLAGSAAKNKLLIVGGVNQAFAGSPAARLRQQNVSLSHSMVNLAGPSA